MTAANITVCTLNNFNSQLLYLRKRVTLLNSHSHLFILKCFIENHKNLIFNSHSLCRNRKTKKNWVINITPYRLNYKKKNSMHMCKYIRVKEKTDILSMEIDYLHVKKLTRVTKTFLRQSKSLLNGIHLKFYFSTNWDLVSKKIEGDNHELWYSLLLKAINW